MQQILETSKYMNTDSNSISTKVDKVHTEVMEISSLINKQISEEKDFAKLFIDRLIGILDKDKIEKLKKSLQ